MRSLDRQHSKSIFAQLASHPGSTGVHTVIENHDAWLHAEEITQHLELTLRKKIHPPATTARIQSQRQALESLLTKLPTQHRHSA